MFDPYSDFFMRSNYLSIEDFINMSLFSRALNTRMYGHYLCSKQSRNCFSSLYQVEHFYVEVTYEPEQQMIASINAFVDTGLLVGYLENVSLKSLIRET